jgi:hypothetical protein
MQTSTKILVYLAVWRRPLITELCFLGIQRLRRSFHIEALAVISEQEMIPLCEKYGINWVFHENFPLGKKKNYGLQKAKEFEFDYLMEIGSDDLILNELVEDYLSNYVGKYDFFGITDCVWIDTTLGECRRIQSNTTYGAGRMISRTALEQVGWKLWSDHITRGLDNNSIFNLHRKKIAYHKCDRIDIPCVIDIKGDENIWKFNYWIGVEYDVGNILERLSDDEKEMLDRCYSTSKG